MQLTGHASYTAISRGCAPISNVFQPIGEKPGQVYHKNALRNRIMEGTKSNDYRYTVFQRHRNEIGGSLTTLWLGHSEWLPSLSKPVPFIGRQHRREYGVICQVENRDQKLPNIGKPNTQVKSPCRRLKSKLA